MTPARSRRSPVPIVVLIAALIAILGVSLRGASAQTFAGNRTVFFHDETLGQDDLVRGDLDVVFGTVTCDSGAEIDGNVRTYGGTFVKLDGCDVRGNVTDAFGSESLESIAPSFSPMSSDDFYRENRSVLRKLAWDVVVLFAFLLFPLRVRVALDRVETHPGLSFATGTMALIAAIPVAILLCITVIGLPLVPLEIAALFAALWIGNAAVGLLIGRRLYELLRPHSTPSPLGALALGLVVITAAETLPGVGWAVSALVVLVGLGSALLGFVRETAFRSFVGGAPGGPPPPGTPGVSPPMNRPA